MIGKRMLFVAAGVLSVMTASAQCTLDECQKLAAQNYPLINRYELIQQTSDYTVSNLSKGYLPQVSVEAQATLQSDVVALPDALKSMLGTSGYDVKGIKKDQYKVGLSVSQIIYDGGSIKAAKAAASAESAAQTKKNDVDLYQLKERVNNLFFGILLLQEKIRLNEDVQKLLLDNCRKIEAMINGGTAMNADRDAVRAEYLNAHQQHTELTSAMKSYQRMLEVFIGKPMTAELVKPDAALIADEQTDRPELQYFDAQIRTIDAKEKQLDASLRPRISLFAQGYYGYPGYNMYEDMFSHNWSLNGIVGVKLGWNISNFYTHNNDKQKLAVSRSEIENAREVFLFNNRLQSIEKCEAIDRYSKIMAEDDEIIRLRTSVRRSAEEKLAHGIIDTNNLLREINKENSAKIALSTHEIELLKSLYDQKYILNK